MKNLNKLGFSKWFLDKIDSSKLSDYEIARVTSVNKNSFQIRKDKEDIFAEVTGKMLFSADTPEDIPTVGDWVLVKFYDDETFSVISEILPRKSVLKRKTSGKKSEYQLIAANIDVAFIIQSFGLDYNLRRLERYLVMVNEGNIKPVVLLSKSDLQSQEEKSKKIAGVKALMPNIEVIEFSNIDFFGINKIKEILTPEKTFCLIGSSGVGKTSLLNNLTDDYVFETNSVRLKDEKGRHITTKRQLISLKNSAMIIDTPGMRELGNIEVVAGINETFNEIISLSKKCKYSNCSHTNEQGCAILQALKEGSLSKERYKNFVKMNKETAFNEMSYFEKKKKDKNFKKTCKSIMRDKTHRR